MTNKEAKQEAIKKAYGNFYDPNKDLIHSDGTVTEFIGSKMEEKGLIMDYFNQRATPQSLQGIKDNNGWIRIEPDGSNLPTDSSKMYKSIINGEVNNNNLNTGWIRSGWEMGHITHYKPITAELKPIY